MNVLLAGNLRAVVDYTAENAKRVCGSSNPEMYLAGFSAGASASAAVALAYPQVTKMLLISPSADIDPEVLRRELSQYQGELYITSGDNDYVVGPKAARTILEWAEKAKVRKIVTVPNCDHQFTGERNGRILSKAYLWAFNGDKNLSITRRRNRALLADPFFWSIPDFQLLSSFIYRAMTHGRIN